MRRFSDDREALDFIASRIAEEAQRDGVPLSEVERKMLYFSETAWTLPDIWTISDEFDRSCDQSAYEKKISQLIKRAINRARKEQPEEFGAWTAAIRHLSKEDRFLLVMVQQAGLQTTFRPHRQRWMRWVTWFVILIVFCCIVGFIATYFPDSTGAYVYPGRRGPLGSYILAAMVCVGVGAAIPSAIFRLLVGGRRFREISGRVLGWLFGD